MTSTVTLTAKCPDGKQVKVSYSNQSGLQTELLSDGQTIELTAHARTMATCHVQEVDAAPAPEADA